MLLSRHAVSLLPAARVGGFLLPRALMADTGSGASGMCRVEEEEEVARGRWLTLRRHRWRDHTGRRRVWEVASRTTEGAGREQDSVAVVARVTSSTGRPTSLVLVKQFRPPLRAYTIEIPAGLVEAGETAESAAIRELQEETGLSGTLSWGGRNVALDPGTSSSTMKLVMVEVDGNSEANRGARRVCGVEGEHTEVLLVPLADLHHRLSEFAAEGLIIDSRVEALAVGLRMSVA